MNKYISQMSKKHQVKKLRRGLIDYVYDVVNF